jgi:hypothetical protein
MQQMSGQIRIGMKVLDRDRNVIGEIDDLKFPENATAPDTEPETDGLMADEDQTGSLMGAIADAFGRDQLPEALRSRLMREGYVHIDADGLFARDRYILPEQIAALEGDGIVLNVARDDLISDPN